MRDIKFRFWNKSIGKMFDVGEIDFNNDWIVSTNETNMYFAQGTLMQYTGLKDKRGVEIYEGDVLQSSTGKKTLVEWINAKWGFRGVMSNERTDVIGNIYENPELLEPQE